MPHLEHTAGCSAVTYLAAISLLQACESMITTLLVDTQWYAAPLPSTAPQALAHIGFVLFQGYVFGNHPLLSACIQSHCHSQKMPKRQDNNLPSLFLTIDAKLLQVTKADVLAGMIKCSFAWLMWPAGADEAKQGLTPDDERMEWALEAVIQRGQEKER